MEERNIQAAAHLAPYLPPSPAGYVEAEEGEVEGEGGNIGCTTTTTLGS